MAESKEYRKLRIAFNANLRRVRGHVAAAKMFMDSGDLTQAYGEAEMAQMAAYDAKEILYYTVYPVTQVEGGN